MKTLLKSQIRKYKCKPGLKKESENPNFSLVWEVKNRKAKFSVKEAEEFVKKAEELMKIENVGKAVLFVFSVNGFFKTTPEYMKKHGIAWTSDRQWVEVLK